jgi:flagellar protein FliS
MHAGTRRTKGTDRPRTSSTSIKGNATMHRDLSPEELEAATPEELIPIMFEGAVRFAGEAREALVDGDHALCQHKAGRVRAIVRELEASLDPDAGTISGHLAAIYDYVLRRLDPETVDAARLAEVAGDLEALGETWSTAAARRLDSMAAAS